MQRKGKEQINKVQADVEAESGSETDYIDSDNCSYIDTDEEAGITGGRRRCIYPSYDAKKGVPTFSLGMIFKDAAEFKVALGKYEIMTRHELKFTKNTKQYVRMKCKNSNCPWKISGSVDEKAKAFQVILLNDEHCCGLINKSKRLNLYWLAEYLMEKFQSIPSMKLPELQKLVKNDLKLEVTIVHCWRAKAILLKKVQGNVKEEFAKLWRYVLELKRSNEDNSIVLEKFEFYTNFILCPEILGLNILIARFREWLR